MKKQKVEKMKMKMKIKMKMKMKMKMMIMIMKMIRKQWIKTKKPPKIKGLNDNLDKIIYKSKSFEEEIKSLKKEKI